jgi:hypothetical protein
MAPVLAAADGTTGSPGVGILLLSLIVGLAIVGVLLLVLTVRNRQHGPGSRTTNGAGPRPSWIGGSPPAGAISSRL